MSDTEADPQAAALFLKLKGWVKNSLDSIPIGMRRQTRLTHSSAVAEPRRIAAAASGRRKTTTR
jgi:hypothetical protein